MSETQTPAAPAATAATVLARYELEGRDVRSALRLLRHGRHVLPKEQRRYDWIVLRHDGADARLETNNLEVSVSVALAGAGHDGDDRPIAVPYVALRDAAARAKGSAPVIVQCISDGTASVAGGGIAATVRTLPEAEHYPPILAGSVTFSAFSAPASSIVGGLETVRRATAEETMRYALRSVLLEVRDGFRGVPIVATDGRRLHAAVLRDATVAPEDPAFPGRGSQRRDLLLSPETVAAICDAWGGRSGAGVDLVVRSSVSPIRAVLVETVRVRIVARMVDGLFPDYRSIVTDALESQFCGATIVDPADAARSLAALERSIGSLAVWRWTADSEGFDVHGKDADGATCSARIAARGWTEDVVTWGANPRFVREALESGANVLYCARPDKKGKFSRPFVVTTTPDAAGAAFELRTIIMPICLD